MVARVRFFIIVLLTLAHGLTTGQQPPPSLSSELDEYAARRADGINRLTKSVKEELLVIQQQEMKAANLDATNAIIEAIEQLPITSEENTTPRKGLPPAATKVLKVHAGKVFAGISGLNAQFIPRLERVKSDLLKAGDVAGANEAAAKIQELKDEATKLAPRPIASRDEPETEESFTVEALIDGNTELHVTKGGIYWMVPGGDAKPGRHENADEPTYVNGRRWKPEWRVSGERGPDTSDDYPIQTTSPKLMVETLNVSKERSGKNENRTPVSTTVKEDHFVIKISDPEGGSRWYKLRIKSVP
jgi:hypothetical protein